MKKGMFGLLFLSLLGAGLSSCSNKNKKPLATYGRKGVPAKKVRQRSKATVITTKTRTTKKINNNVKPHHYGQKTEYNAIKEELVA